MAADWTKILADAGIPEPVGRPELIQKIREEMAAELAANGGMRKPKAKPKPKTKSRKRK